MLLFLSCDRTEWHPATLEIDGSNVVEVSADGGRRGVNIIASGQYEARVDPSSSDWISINGDLIDATSFSVAENNSSEPREGRIFFSLKGAVTQVLTIIQQAAEIVRFLSVEKNDYLVPLQGGEVEVIVNSYLPAAVRIREGDEWIELKDNQIGEFIFNVSAIEDEMISARRGTLVFSCEGCPDVEVSIVQQRQFVRKSLVMRFTGDWCGYCPFMSFNIHNAQALYPDAIEDVSVYYNSAASLSCAEAGRLISAFNVTGYPTAIMDFRASVNLSQEKGSAAKFPDVFVESRDCYDAASGIALSAVQDGSKVRLNVGVVSNCADADALLLVLVAEDAIHARQSFYGVPSQYPDVDFSDYRHDSVLKGCLTSTAGDALPLTPGSLRRSYEYVADAWVNLAEVSFVVAVLRSRPADAVEAVKGVSYIGSKYYVDNVQRVRVGENKSIIYR